MPDAADPVSETKEKKKSPPPRDPAREVVETIVFVVVLVLLLKLFVTEAFVIPTGSMAETLYGYQKMVKCPKCGHLFPVNSHDEVEGRQGDGKRMMLYGYTCPNCRHFGRIEAIEPVPGNSTGDRVLVLKPLFHARDPRRGDVVVFKWPERPQEKFTAQNYIKRCMGFGGETLAIHRGDLFMTRALEYKTDVLDEYGRPLYPQPTDPLDKWKPRYMYSTTSDGNPLAANLFDASRAAGFPAGSSGFEIVRKDEEQLLADLRMVWDNDKQPTELAGKVAPRWYASGSTAWTGDNALQPKVFGHDKPELHWIRYRHLAMPWKSEGVDGPDPTPKTTTAELASQQPVPIDNFLGYNAGRSIDPIGGRAEGRDHSGTDKLWVGDLSLECKARTDPGAEIVLELSKGVNRFQATFAEGKVTLTRTGPGGDKFGSPSRACKFAAGKEHTLRFANIDCKLWVWVDGKRVDFGTEGDYSPATPDQEAAFPDTEPDKDGKEVPKGQPGAQPEGWTRANDILAPAGIGAKGKATVQGIVLQRDIYYTRKYPDSRPEKLDTAFHGKADIYYVQPGHYMCMGDNSAQSSDSRNWGTVPERLMLGKAVFVFWPAWPNNRVGFIK